MHGSTTHTPRRIQLDKLTPAEHAIRDAVVAVERAGADVRLTDAVVLLEAARESVADYIDGVESRRWAVAPRTLPPARAQETPREATTTVIPKALRESWRSKQGEGLESAVGEYTPAAFWQLLDAYEALLHSIHQAEPRPSDRPSTAGVTEVTHNGQRFVGGTGAEIIDAMLYALRLNGVEKLPGKGWKVSVGTETTTFALLTEALAFRIHAPPSAAGVAVTEAMSKALRTAATTFFAYAALHEAKGTPEGIAKAAVNRALGEDMVSALTAAHSQQTPSAAGVSDAARSVLAERERQRSKEGWTEAHDDEHIYGELADAAACYAVTSEWRGATSPIWPFDRSWWRPTPDDRRRELVKAGALILAEIERLDRAAREVQPSSAAGGSEEVVPPRPAFTVEISVGACDWNRLTTEPVRAAEHVQEHGASCNRVWGGAGTHGHVHITRRDVTQEQYNAELMAWHTSGRAAREVQP